MQACLVYPGGATETAICQSFFFFLPHQEACGILVPQPGIKLMPPTAGGRALKHWGSRGTCKFEKAPLTTGEGRVPGTDSNTAGGAKWLGGEPSNGLQSPTGS